MEKKIEQVLKISHEDKAGRGRGNDSSRGGRGRGRRRQSFNKAAIECFKCHKLGHYQYECPDWEKNANYAELEKEKDEELLLMSYVELEQAKMEEVWFLDSCCSNHMTGNKEWFSELDESFSQTVKLGNNTRMDVVGKVIICMQVNGFTQAISGVYYVPELKNNLLSIRQLQEKGLTILIQHGKCRVYHSEKGLIMQSDMSGNRRFSVLATMIPKAS